MAGMGTAATADGQQRCQWRRLRLLAANDGVAAVSVATTTLMSVGTAAALVARWSGRRCERISLSWQHWRWCTNSSRSCWSAGRPAQRAATATKRRRRQSPHRPVRWLHSHRMMLGSMPQPRPQPQTARHAQPTAARARWLRGAACRLERAAAAVASPCYSTRRYSVRQRRAGILITAAVAKRLRSRAPSDRLCSPCDRRSRTHLVSYVRCAAVWHQDGRAVERTHRDGCDRDQLDECGGQLLRAILCWVRDPTAA